MRTMQGICTHKLHTHFGYAGFDYLLHCAYIVHVKQNKRFHMRMPEDVHDRFMASCEALGVPASHVVRDLLVAAANYMELTCKPHGRWFPPRLEQEMAEIKAPQLRMVAERSPKYVTSAPMAGVAVRTEHSHRK